MKKWFNLASRYLMINKLSLIFFIFLVLTGSVPLKAQENPNNLSENVSLNYTQIDWPITLMARIVIPAPPGTVWIILTDYDHLTEFLPQMESSQVVGHSEERIIVQLTSRMHFLFFMNKIQVILSILERSKDEISFFRTGGNMELFSGKWILKEIEGGKSTQLTYILELKPSFYAPRWVIRHKLDHEIPKMLHLISKRAEKLGSK